MNRRGRLLRSLPTAPIQANETLFLLFGGVGDRLRAARRAGLGAERDVEPRQAIAAANEKRDLVAGPVLLEPRRQPVRAHAHVVDRKNLVVDVQAGGDTPGVSRRTLETTSRPPSLRVVAPSHAR